MKMDEFEVAVTVTVAVVVVVATEQPVVVCDQTKMTATIRASIWPTAKAECIGLSQASTKAKQQTCSPIKVH